MGQPEDDMAKVWLAAAERIGLLPLAS